MSYIAEQNVIGSLIQSPSLIDEVITILTPAMFKNEILRNAYVEFASGADQNQKVDLAILIERLPRDTLPVGVVMEELKSAIANTQTTSTCRSFAVTLSNEYRAKELKDFLSTIRSEADTVNDDIESILQRMESLRLNDVGHIKTLSEIVVENKDNYFKEDMKPKILTGLSKLDEILGGFDGGDLILIGARPAVGKSAFATQLAMYFAEQLNLRVGYFNLEMQEKQMYERFVASKSGIEITRIRRAIRFLDDEQERFDKANEYLMTVDKIFISTGSKKVSEIRSECRGHNFDVIIIDYLQLVKSDSYYRGNRYAEVGQISHATKALAMDLNIPVIALCQLNRASEGRDSKEPTMSDLRESGDFEQDASTILLLWNSSQENRYEKCIKVEKQRQGKNGKVDLEFDGNRMKFIEVNDSSNQWEGKKKSNKKTLKQPDYDDWAEVKDEELYVFE